EYSAPGGGVRGGERSVGGASGVPGPEAGDHRGHDLAVSERAAGGDQKPGGTCGAVSGFRSVRYTAVLLRIGRGVCVSVAVGGVRAAAIGGDGVRGAGGGVERELAAGGGGGGGGAGEPGERVRYCARDSGGAAG